jgi:phosphate starvation-inducible PhoH-like protein
VPFWPTLQKPRLHRKDFGVKTTARDSKLTLEGEAKPLERAERLVELLRSGKAQGMTFRGVDIENLAQMALADAWGELDELFKNPAVINLPKGTWVAKTLNQKKYIQSIRAHEVVFSVGPAGTGKTYLAVALALEALQNGLVKKIILTRPAVEAGEALGFLPGELEEKILPYLRPLYDAMDEMVGHDQIERMVTRGWSKLRR